MCPVSQIFLYGTLISVTPFAMTCVHGRHKLLNMCVFLCPAFICVHMCPARQICLSTFCGTFASINLVVDQGSHSALTWLVLLMHYFFEHADICVDIAFLGHMCALLYGAPHTVLPTQSGYASQVMHTRTACIACKFQQCRICLAACDRPLSLSIYLQSHVR